MLNKWKNKNSKEYAKTLIKCLGKPDEETKSMMLWTKKANCLRIEIRDESISHDFPMRHKDYVYSTRKIVVPPKFVSVFSNVTGSIIIDGLKKEVTARCGALIKNAVTLGFVEDMIKGKISSSVPAAKKEYSKRIMGNITPKWFKDVAKDKKVMKK